MTHFYVLLIMLNGLNLPPSQPMDLKACNAAADQAAETLRKVGVPPLLISANCVEFWK